MVATAQGVCTDGPANANAHRRNKCSVQEQECMLIVYNILLEEITTNNRAKLQ